MPNIEDFISTVRNKGLARTEKFSVQIFPPQALLASAQTENNDRLTHLTLMCEEATIPGININTRAARIHNLDIQRPMTIDYMGDGITFGFLIDGSWDVKKFFDDWIDLIIDRNREINEYNKIKGSVIVNALHEGPLNEDEFRNPYKENIRYAIRLVDAFPRSVDSIQTSYSNVGVHRLNVVFCYKYWVK